MERNTRPNHPKEDVSIESKKTIFLLLLVFISRLTQSLPLKKKKRDIG
jgi:hypothetical protein